MFKCNKGAEDVNGDGFVDQICHFATQLAGFEAGDSAGVLRGYTVGGTPIIGTDAITIVGR